MRKICVVTGSRAEYDLLKGLMHLIKHDLSTQLQIIVTGMHLSPEFGSTYKEIEADGFLISQKIETLISSDSGVGVSKSIGLGVISFADALDVLKPEIICVLGDRFEIFAAAIAAMNLKIPIAHIHGGEKTEGAIDEAIRHSITKMSHLHFVAANEFRNRIIQLGENPDRVKVVGGLGVDRLNEINLLSREEMENELSFSFKDKSLLITFHPTTAIAQSSSFEMDQLLEALDSFPGLQLIFTMPNADSGGRELRRQIMDFVKIHPNARAYESMGQLKYLSCMNIVDAVVGNSSSGLLEAPYLKKGVVNIGDRQKGRLQGDNVINCAAFKEDIRAAIEKIYSDAFQLQLLSMSSPYGNPGASNKIFQELKSVDLNLIYQKAFFDL